MSKKMCAYSPRKNKVSTEVPPVSTASNVAFVKQYTRAELREGKEWYIEFYAYDPALARLRRKKIKLNRIKKITERRAYAREVIGRINTQLQRGWNPWIAKDVGTLHIFGEVCDAYEAYIDKMFNIGYFRKETWAGYKSYLKNVREYAADKSPIYYLYQFDHAYIVEFLEHIFIERNNGAQTRNNYLAWLSVFCGWCVERNYFKSRPTDGISAIDKRHIVKTREVIPTDIVKRIGEWLAENDRPFLLACHLLYNCFIRPVEMTRLKIGWINIKEGTITIPAEASKNRETMVVTLPVKVLHYAIDLGIFNSPSGDYIFSEKLLPGPTQIDTKIFRDHWKKVRKALNLKKEWQFYSLKDTGITEMLDSHIASITVRDQARHSSLAITELYTRHMRKANKDVLEWEGSL